MITDASVGGLFNFDSTYTKGPLDNSTAAPRGQALAAFLMGLPSGGSTSYVDSYYEMSTLWSGYFQDDWKVNRKLSLNLSLRYELEGPVTERFNRSVRGFDPGITHSSVPGVGNFDALAAAAYALNPITERPVSAWSTKGGLQYAGVNGAPQELTNRDTNNFMPRIGFAYSPNQSTSIRGGYGIYYGFLGMRRQDVIQTNFSQVTNLVPTNDNGLTFVATLSNPYPNGYLQPIKAGLGGDTYLGQSISFFPAKVQGSRTQKFALNIQRTLGQGILVEVGYIGSRSDQLEGSRAASYFPSQYLSRSPARDQPVINYWTFNAPNPFRGLVPGTSRNGSTTSRDALVRPYPQFSAVNNRAFEGKSSYNALQARLERRFVGGYTVQFSYTWSKLMDQTGFMRPDDAAPERVIAASDYPHHVGASFIYELPFGRGRRFLSNTRRAEDLILGGWQVSSVWNVQSGSPLGFGDAIYNGANLADVALPADQRTWQRWFDTSQFERSTAKQLSYHYQVLSSRFAFLRSSRLNAWDMSAIKNVRVKEGMNAQFRADFLNAFNQVWLVAPNTTPSSTSFGQVSRQGSTPRRIQLQLKFVF